MAHGRPVALVTAAVLVSEAAGVVALHWVLGVMVDRQDMSLAGLDPRVMSVAAWTAGAVLGAYLLLCGALLLRTGLTDRAPGRPTRALLVGAAVLHGVLGAVCVGLVGWAAFAALALVLALLVLTLTAWGPRDAGTVESAGPSEPAGPGPDAPPLTPTSP